MTGVTALVVVARHVRAFEMNPNWDVVAVAPFVNCVDVGQSEQR